MKEYALGAASRDAIVAYLIGDPVLGRSPTAASAALGAWSVREPSLGLAEYLLARAYAGEGRYGLVATSLDRALGKELGIGLLLPCNVTVFEGDEGQVVVQFIKPQSMFEVVRTSGLEPVVEEADARLKRALANI